MRLTLFLIISVACFGDNIFLQPFEFRPLEIQSIEIGSCICGGLPIEPLLLEENAEDFWWAQFAEDIWVD
jgi:hypothetical protein